MGVKNTHAEKNPGEGSEIEPETVYVQAVGAYLLGDCVPFVSWVSDLYSVASITV